MQSYIGLIYLNGVFSMFVNGSSCLFQEMRPIFCGNFEYDARQNDLERLFGRYGKVDRVDMKAGEFFCSSCVGYLSICLKLIILLTLGSFSFPCSAYFSKITLSFTCNKNYKLQLF